VDERVLAAIPIVDGALVERWEERSAFAADADRVAVVVHEVDPPPRVQRCGTCCLPRRSPPSRPHPASRRHERRPPCRGGGCAALVEGGPARERPGDPRTLREALARAARTFPGNAIVHHRPGADDEAQTFGGLLVDAERVLAGLRSRGLEPRSNVLLALDDSREILPAFWGCVLGGFVPVIVAPPTIGDPQRAIEQLRGVFQRLGGPFVVAGDGRLPEPWLNFLDAAAEGPLGTSRDHRACPGAGRRRLQPHL
jgi:hypothetical protein